MAYVDPGHNQALPIPEEWEEIRRQHREESTRMAEPVEAVDGDDSLDTKMYRNVSKRTVFECKPGDTVELPVVGAVDALVESGVLEEVTEAPVAEEAPESEAVEETSADEEGEMD